MKLTENDDRCSTQLAKMSIDPRLVEVKAGVAVNTIYTVWAHAEVRGAPFFVLLFFEALNLLSSEKKKKTVDKQTNAIDTQEKSKSKTRMAFR